MKLLHWLSEGYHTFSVTTLHPIGWGVQKIHHRWHRETVAEPRAILAEHEHPVLLIHGIFHNATAFYQLEKAIRRASFHTQAVELWTAVTSLTAMATQLKREALIALARLERKRGSGKPPLKLRLVAHSLGGMVTRVALLDPTFAEQVDKVIFLGTPHQGSPMFSLPFPACITEIRHDSHTLKRLREEPLPGNIRYYNLRGDLDLITPARTTFLPNVHNVSFAGVGHAGLLSNPHVIQSVVEILESPFYDAAPERSIG